MSQQFQDDDVIPHGGEIVERFGGIRPMASKLNVPVTTVQGWKKRDAIPAIRRDEILTAAATYDVDLKGLLNEGGNDNARKSTIAEDPALTAASNVRPIQQPQAAPQAPRQNTYVHTNPGSVDMRQIKSAARRTSLITTGAMIAIAAAAGFLLFGGPGKPDGRRVASLEGRVSTLEQQSTTSTGSVINQTVASLQQKVNELSNAGPAIATRLTALEQQFRNMGTPGMASVAGSVAAMASTPEGQQTIQTAVDDLRGMVTGMQGRMDGFDSALAQAKTENDALGRTLSDVSGRDLGAAAMLLTLTSIRTSVDRQTPFADDLALLKTLAGTTDPELGASIDKMAPYAEDGVLSPQALKRELQGSANDIITAKLKGEDVSMKDKVLGRLKGLFSIKKDGQEVGGSEERALIDQASAQLDAGDVKGAMATLDQLEGPAAQEVAPWQQAAAGTVAAPDLQAQLIQSIMTKIHTAMTTMASGVGGSATGVVNAGPINMAPQQPPMQQQAAPVAPQVAPAPTPAPEMIAPEAGTPTQDAAPLPYPGEPGQRGSGVIITQ